MKHAYVFPGQGSQAVGMGKEIYDNVPEAKELFEKANDEIKSNERCRLFYANALANCDRVDEAEDILTGGGKKNLVVSDIRECEETVTNLWFLIRRKRGVSESEMGNPPLDFDFRMWANKD